MNQSTPQSPRRRREWKDDFSSFNSLPQLIWCTKCTSICFSNFLKPTLNSKYDSQNYFAKSWPNDFGKLVDSYLSQWSLPLYFIKQHPQILSKFWPYFVICVTLLMLKLLFKVNYLIVYNFRVTCSILSLYQDYK